MQLALRATGYLNKLTPNQIKGEWAPEAGEYSIESNPIQPYLDTMANWLTVEENLENRLLEANAVMTDNDHVVSNCIFGRIGCPNYTG